MTRELRNAYSRGYAAGCRRSDPQLEKARALAADAAARAERAEKASGIGHCEECAFWVRGGNDAYEYKAQCAWGACNVGKAPGTPWGTWAHPPDGNDTSIVTSPRFGCVLFKPAEMPPV
jgi:hypothetical protein